MHDPNDYVFTSSDLEYIYQHHINSHTTTNQPMHRFIHLRLPNDQCYVLYEASYSKGFCRKILSMRQIPKNDWVEWRNGISCNKCIKYFNCGYKSYDHTLCSICYHKILN